MEKVDLEAQAPAEAVPCPRCFHVVPTGYSTCPECGMRLREDGVDRVNSSVEPELAKANLSRLRGDFSSARGQLLAILRRFPNHAGAHELLGDVYEEEDDLEQAAQWYELALDLDPDAPGLASKHADVIFRLAKMEQDQVHDRIGLATPDRPWLPLAITGIICVVALLGLWAFIKRDTKAKAITTSFVATSEVKPVEGPSASPSPSPSITPTPTMSVTNTGMTTSDLSAKERLNRTAGGEHVIALQSDPRGSQWILTLKVEGTEDPKAVAAESAKAVFTLFPNCTSVVIRIVTGGELTYLADSDRATYEKTQSQEWKSANDDPLAWINELVKNEWRAPK